MHAGGKRPQLQVCNSRFQIVSAMRKSVRFSPFVVVDLVRGVKSGHWKEGLGWCVRFIYAPFAVSSMHSGQLSSTKSVSPQECGYAVATLAATAVIAPQSLPRSSCNRVSSNLPRMGLGNFQQPALQRHEEALEDIGPDRCPAIQVPEPAVTPLGSRRPICKGQRDLERRLNEASRHHRVGIPLHAMIKSRGNQVEAMVRMVPQEWKEHATEGARWKEVAARTPPHAEESLDLGAVRAPAPHPGFLRSRECTF